MFRSNAATLLVLGLVLAAGPGCRSFQGNLMRRDVAQAPQPKPDQPDPEELARRVALEHDRRAGLVRSLRIADLNIKIDTFRDQAGRDRSPLLGGTAAGVLVMERPKNLRVLLRKPMGVEIADIGSNDREFWFANDMANEMVVGNYAQTEGFADPMLSSVRPDWIFEVLGLEPLAFDEVVRGETEATLTLVEHRTLANGVAMVKESVLNVAEQRIVEHRLYTEGRRELIARARADQPQPVKIGAALAGEPPPTIEMPGVVRLTVPDVAELTMYLRGVEPNPEFDFAKATSFERPEKAGYAVVDVFELTSDSGVALAASPPAPGPQAQSQQRSPRGPAPGALAIPRSDRSVSRTEDLAATTRGATPNVEQASSGGAFALDLPSPSTTPAAVLRRETWETVQGNRFRRGVLARE